MLQAQLLAATDSTGQRITLIVIGLLLAALALAVLTAWYYRITDPGPRQPKPGRGLGRNPGGGTAGTDNPKPRPGPGWKARLSNMAVPAADDEFSDSGTLGSPSSATASDKVSLEGGQYLDLTEIPRDDGVTNVGSPRSLDLRQPAPLKDPDELAASTPATSVPVSGIGSKQSAAQAEGLSFDEWLADVEATDDL